MSTRKKSTVVINRGYSKGSFRGEEGRQGVPAVSSVPVKRKLSTSAPAAPSSRSKPIPTPWKGPRPPLLPIGYQNQGVSVNSSGRTPTKTPAKKPHVESEASVVSTSQDQSQSQATTVPVPVSIASTPGTPLLPPASASIQDSDTDSVYSRTSSRFSNLSDANISNCSTRQRMEWCFKIPEKYVLTEAEFEACSVGGGRGRDWTSFAHKLSWTPELLREDATFVNEVKRLRCCLDPIVCDLNAGEGATGPLEVRRVVWKGSIEMKKKARRSHVIKLLRADENTIQFKKVGMEYSSSVFDPDSSFGNSYNVMEGPLDEPFSQNSQSMSSYGEIGSYVDPLDSSDIECDNLSCFSGASTPNRNHPHATRASKTSTPTQMFSFDAGPGPIGLEENRTHTQANAGGGFLGFMFRRPQPPPPPRDRRTGSSFYTENAVYQDAFKQPTATAALDYLQQLRPKDLALHRPAITRSIDKFYANKNPTPRSAFPLSSFSFPRIPKQMLDDRVIIITGHPGCGKTEYVRAHFKNPLVITRLEELVDQGSWDLYDGLILDEPALESVRRTDMKYLFDKSLARTFRLTYNTIIKIPAGMRRVVVSYKTAKKLYTEWRVSDADAEYIKSKVYTVRLPGKIYESQNQNAHTPGGQENGIGSQSQSQSQSSSSQSQTTPAKTPKPMRTPTPTTRAPPPPLTPRPRLTPVPMPPFTPPSLPLHKTY